MKEQLYCIVCGKELTGLQKKFCCNNCKQKDNYNKRKELNNNNLYLEDSRGIFRKMQLILEKGGKCEICGYNKNLAALDFHHVNPLTKEFSLDKRTLGNKSMEKIQIEANKCQLLCSNCHREIHNPEATFENIIKLKENNLIKFNPKTFDPKYSSNNYCKCGKEIEKDAKQCKECHFESRRTVERPSKEKLLELILQFPFTTIGKMYGVSDNSIRKWCKLYELPYKQKDIKNLKL